MGFPDVPDFRKGALTVLRPPPGRLNSLELPARGRLFVFAYLKTRLLRPFLDAWKSTPMPFSFGPDLIAALDHGIILPSSEFH